MEESNEELLARKGRVVKMIDERHRRLQKMKAGNAKDNAARFLGSLEFTLGQIHSKMEDRGLN